MQSVAKLQTQLGTAIRGKPERERVILDGDKWELTMEEEAGYWKKE